MAPVSPFGVPQTLSAAFFGGLWGIAYAAAEPWLAARLGWPAGGLAFGILPLVVLWFVVFPLNGIPVGGGFTAFGLQQGVVLPVAFGQIGRAHVRTPVPHAQVVFRLLLDKKKSMLVENHTHDQAGHIVKANVQNT